MAAHEDATTREGRGPLTRADLNRAFLLVVVIGITLLFLVMIRGFFVTVILAAVFAAMSRPGFQWITGTLRGRRRTAALLVVVAVLILILVPLGAFLTLVVGQAVDLTERSGPWLLEQSARWPELSSWLRDLPIIGPLIPDRGALVARAGELVTLGGTFLIANLGAATTGTANGVLQLFVMLYAMYFFLLDGPAILSRILYYTPLEEAEEEQLIDRFVSVTRATIRGSILVGMIQGGLAGAAFFVLGLPGAAFWATVMAVLSVIPVLGSGLVWAPAALILISTGRGGAGLGLVLWGALVVGTIDNLLRPKFVGRDIKMHDLLVLLSTFGGLAMFGLSGFIIGPIIAALFLTAWSLYEAAFKELLPAAPRWLAEPPSGKEDALGPPHR